MTIQHLLKGLQPSELAPQVVLGFCDLDGSSLKALAALGPASGCTCAIRPLELHGGPASGTPAPRPAAFADDRQTPSACHGPASLISISRPGESTPQISILSINTPLPDDEQAYLAADLMSLVAAAQQLHRAAGSSPVPPCLHILASTLIPLAKQPGVHVLHSPQAQQQPLAQLLSASCAALPASGQLQDNMLALLHHMAVATGASVCFLLVPGYRPPAGSSAEKDSLEGAGRLLPPLLGALASGAPGVLAATDLGLLGPHLMLQNSWFSGSRQGVMYC